MSTDYPTYEENIVEALWAIKSAIEELTVKITHANPSGDLRGEGRTEADAPGSLPRGRELSDSGAGVGPGAGSSGASPVRGEPREAAPGAQSVPGEGGAEKILSHRPLAKRIVALMERDLVDAVRIGSHPVPQSVQDQVLDSWIDSVEEKLAEEDHSAVIGKFIKALMARCETHAFNLLSSKSTYKTIKGPEHFNGSNQWPCKLTEEECELLWRYSEHYQ